MTNKIIHAPRYKYEPGNYDGFIVLRRVDEHEGGVWSFGYEEIGEWCATEEEAQEAVRKLSEAREV